MAKGRKQSASKATKKRPTKISVAKPHPKVKWRASAGSKADVKGASRDLVVLVGTRKGAFLLRSDAARTNWKLAGPHFLGSIIYHVVLDPRDRKTLLVTARTGHLGPTIFRSTDLGKNWTEAQRPPAFPKVGAGRSGRVVDHTFWLTPGHTSEPEVWYAGTSPQGLFRSRDGGMTWDGVAGFNDHPDRPRWCGGDQDATPDGAKMHSILVDPREPRHLYLGMSSGGVFESLDRGDTWRRLNEGCDRVFAVDDPDDGHDPHCIRMPPSQPDRLYMQNHCGIYRLDRPSDKWERVGRNMPKAVGDVGFPMTIHPRDPDIAWVFPMDGGTVWPRTSPDGKPAVYRTRNAGKTWKRQDVGLPVSQAWYTVKRQAMTADEGAPVGVYFGTTSGEVWMSRDEGEKWVCIANHLPHIYSVEAANL